MNTLQMLLKGFGIEVDPEEVVRIVQDMAKNIAELRASILRTEEKVDILLAQKQDTENERHSTSTATSGKPANSVTSQYARPA
jgi:hypothetical protein